MKENPMNILLTGATGFLGKQLIDYILKNSQDKLYILIRGKNGQPYKERFRLKNKRIIPIEGDITDNGVFKSEETVDTLDKVIDTVIHSAAWVGFKKSDRNKTFRINNKGTLNLIDRVKNFKKLKAFHYVSSSYVCGLIEYPERFLEAPTEEINAKNPYEESKQKTERDVINSGLPYTILRPSIVVGSSDGTKYDTKTIYAIFTGILFGKLKYMKNKGIPYDQILSNVSLKVPIAGDDNAYKNLIPVDILTEMIYKIVKNISPEGKIYHLCNPENFKARLLIEKPADILGISGLYYKHEEDINQEVLPTYAKRIHSFTGEFVDYLTLSDPTFSMKNTMGVVGERYISKIQKPTPEFLRFLFNSFFFNKFGQKFNLYKTNL